jgi:hypothetical protein
MENLDLSSLEFDRDAATGVSDFSVSLEEEESGEHAIKLNEISTTSFEDSVLSTDYTKVSFTLAEVIILPLKFFKKNFMYFNFRFSTEKKLRIHFFKENSR